MSSPQDNEASEPTDPATEDTPIQWWRPGWHDVIATAGWWWILLGVATIALALVLAAILLLTGFAFTGLLLKPAAVLVGGAVVLVGYVIRKATQARREPFCIFCGYCLAGLPDDYRCPECGRAYTWRQIDDYRRDPQWFIERWKARQNLPPPDPRVDTGPARPRRRSKDGTS